MDKNHHCKDEEDGKDCMQEQEREGGQSAEDRVEAKLLRLVRNREKRVSDLILVAHCALWRKNQRWT